MEEQRTTSIRSPVDQDYSIDMLSVVGRIRVDLRSFHFALPVGRVQLFRLSVKVYFLFRSRSELRIILPVTGSAGR